MHRCVLVSLAALVACRGAASSPAPAPAPAPRAARSPVTLTYLGVAGWQLDGGGRTVLVDPYLSRPDLDGVIASDPAAIAAHAPARADLIVISHSHVDHLLDAPAIARATGAEVLGSDSTARVARADGVADDHVIPIRGGEDYAFAGFSVRVIPSLHSALGGKHVLGRAISVVPPVRFADWEEGGTFAYLVRLAGHEIFVQGTANFIERELEGLRPDIAILAPGLRQEIHDYTCRLLRVLGRPPVVYVTHFDDWRHAPTDPPPDSDTAAFAREITACAPGTRVVIPRHFVAMTER